MVLLESLNLPLGSDAHDFNLPGIDGEDHSLENYKGAKALVVIFMCNHCPYVQAVIERLIILQKKFPETEFVGINSNDSDGYPEDGFDKMKEYAEDWGLNFDYLRDETQEVAKIYKAQCTPDIYVFDKDQKLAYHGRIDDNWQHEDKATTQELHDALEALMKGENPSDQQYPSMGCSIKWK